MILILDFGSQYTQVIARKIRESQVYCEIYPGNKKIDDIENISSVEAVILSGGPSSVYEKGAPIHYIMTNSYPISILYSISFQLFLFL